MAANGGFGSKLPPLSPTNAADIRSDAANTGASVMQSQHFHCAPTAVRRSNPDRSAFAALIATAAVAIASMLPTIVAAQTPGALDANFALGNGKIPAIAMGAGTSTAQSVNGGDIQRWQEAIWRRIAIDSTGCPRQSCPDPHTRLTDKQQISV